MIHAVKVLLFSISLMLCSCTWLSSGSRNTTAVGAWTEISYSVTANKTINDVLQEITSLTGQGFEVDGELQALLDEFGAELPILSNLTVGQVLALVQGVMPPALAFDYQILPNGKILLRPRFLESENPLAPHFEIATFDLK